MYIYNFIYIYACVYGCMDGCVYGLETRQFKIKVSQCKFSTELSLSPHCPLMIEGKSQLFGAFTPSTEAIVGASMFMIWLSPNFLVFQHFTVHIDDQVWANKCHWGSLNVMCVCLLGSVMRNGINEERIFQESWANRFLSLTMNT